MTVVDSSTVAGLMEELLDDRFKGIPNGAEPFSLNDLGKRHWSLTRGDVPLPLLVARSNALGHNIDRMQRYCREHGVELAPHGKTTMCPQIFQRQMAAGAWGLTAATIEQLAIYTRFGFKRIILANQVAGVGNLNRLGQVLKANDNLELFLFVESVRGAKDLAETARHFNLTQPICVLLEVGYAGGRTGVRTLSEAEVVAQEIATSAELRLCGVAAFEGLIPTEHDRHDDKTRALLLAATEVVDVLVGTNLLPDEFIVTAGGSAAFDLVVEAFARRWGRRSTVILRSGCYVTHDHGLYAATSPLAESEDPLQQVLELWSYVQSRPEPQLAYATFGRRDAPYDSGMPTPIARIRRGEAVRRSPDGIVVESLNDQHARLTLSAETELDVGDILICGVSHPCSAFDRWRLIMTIDDANQITGGLRTFF